MTNNNDDVIENVVTESDTVNNSSDNESIEVEVNEEVIVVD